MTHFVRLILLLPGFVFAVGCAVSADKVVDNGDDEWVDFDDSANELASDDNDDDDNPGDSDDSDIETDGTVDSELSNDTSSGLDSDSSNDTDTSFVNDSATASDTETEWDGDTSVDSATTEDSDIVLGSDSDTETNTATADTDSVTSADTATEADTGSEDSTDTAFTDTGTGTTVADTDTGTVDTETETGETDTTSSDTETETGTATDTDTDTDTGTGSDVGTGIYMTYGSVWQGYGWTTTGSADGGVISVDLDPGDYELGVDSLCITGSTAADYNSQGGIGFNLDQAKGATGEEAALWVPSPTYTSFTYEIVTNTALRVEIVHSEDGVETAYCTTLSSTGALSGTLNLTDFRTNCWGTTDNVYYTTTTGLLRVSVYVAGQESGSIDYDFCIDGLQPE